MPRKNRLRRRVEEATKELRQAESKLNRELGLTLAHCTRNCYGKGCGGTTPIQDLTYIQTHYYVPPHSCAEGDYWQEKEGQFDCPWCGHRNRLYDRPEIDQLKSLFGRVVDTYDTNWKPRVDK